MAFRTGGAAGESAAAGMPDRSEPQAGQPERFQLVLVGGQQGDHVFRFPPPSIEWHALRPHRLRLIVEEADGHSEHAFVAEFNESRDLPGRPST